MANHSLVFVNTVSHKNDISNNLCIIATIVKCVLSFWNECEFNSTHSWEEKTQAQSDSIV